MDIKELLNAQSEAIMEAMFKLESVDTADARLVTKIAQELSWLASNDLQQEGHATAETHLLIMACVEMMASYVTTKDK